MLMVNPRCEARIITNGSGMAFLEAVEKERAAKSNPAGTGSGRNRQWRYAFHSDMPGLSAPHRQRSGRIGQNSLNTPLAGDFRQMCSEIPQNQLGRVAGNFFLHLSYSRIPQLSEASRAPLDVTSRQLWPGRESVRRKASRGCMRLKAVASPSACMTVGAWTLTDRTYAGDAPVSGLIR